MENIFGVVVNENSEYKIDFSVPNIFLLDLSFDRTESLSEFYAFLKDNTEFIKTEKTFDENFVLNDLKFTRLEILEEFTKLLQSDKINYDETYNFKFGKLVSSKV